MMAYSYREYAYIYAVIQVFAFAYCRKSW